MEGVDRQSQYVRLGADGHLGGYVWKEQSSEWMEVALSKNILITAIAQRHVAITVFAEMPSVVALFLNQ
ncbi:hypothetical protein CFP56_041844 [Quercus suber]|uniref:Uncharacterized protein n=1 Tax=Quercus suber TaxID=58331 RepID=A0AAW0IUW4_QUESU